MSSLFLKRDLQAAAKDAVPIGATTNKKSKQDFKMPKPPPGAPPPMMIRMTQEEADTASATLKEQHVDAIVISIDNVDVPTMMDKGLQMCSEYGAGAASNPGARSLLAHWKA